MNNPLLGKLRAALTLSKRRIRSAGRIGDTVRTQRFPGRVIQRELIDARSVEQNNLVTGKTAARPVGLMYRKNELTILLSQLPK